MQLRGLERGRGSGADADAADLAAGDPVPQALHLGGLGEDDQGRSRIDAVLGRRVVLVAAVLGADRDDQDLGLLPDLGLLELAADDR